MTSEIRYFLSAEVDGILVYSGQFEDTTLLQESLYKAELSVQKELEEGEEL